MKLWWFFAFFVVSGFCSLVYQVVWLRLAMAGFGVTTPLVSIVLSVFMAGLAVGSWAAGRLATRLTSRGVPTFLRLYALAELVIAFSGETVPAALRWGRHVVSDSAGSAEWGSLSHYVSAGMWIALTLLPFCVAMGATFPLAMAAIRKGLPRQAALSFSYLYLANVIGASLGPLATALVLIEVFGFQGTLRVTAALSALLAAAAFALSFSLRAPAPEAALEAPDAEDQSAPAFRVSPAAATAMLFTTGLVSMGMEVVWLRQFTPYLGTVVYAFASILSLYLVATFVGSRIYRSWTRSARAGGNRWVMALLAFSGLLPLVGADPRLPIEAESTWVLARVVLGVVPFCAAVGFLTPLLVDRVAKGDARRAGAAYAANVVGCILGPLLSGFALLPLLGERWSLLALTLPLGLVAWKTTRWPVIAAAAALSVLVLAFTRDYETLFPRRTVRRDATATTIATGEGFGKNLLINGVGITGLTPITKMMAHLPLTYLDQPPRSALVICFGMGTTFRSLLSWGISATAVELVPSVPGLFAYFHSDGDLLLQSPRARIVVDDGRRFLERTGEQFDVITLDPPPPVEAAGSSLLYSLEFYSVAKKRLRPDGVLQQWLPGGDEATRSAVARALMQSFPHVRAFRSAEGWGLHFLASLRPLPTRTPSELASRLPPAAVDDLLEWSAGSTAEQELAAVLSQPRRPGLIVRLAPGTPALRDDRPINEYYFLRRLSTRRTGAS